MFAEGARTARPPTSEAMLQAFAFKDDFSKVRCAMIRFALIGGRAVRAPTANIFKTT